MPNIDEIHATAMLVDEQRTVARGIESMLEDAPDIDLIWCRDEREAERMACHHGPTVILQDINMPHLDGFEMLARYRNNDAIRDIPVIMLSGEQAAETKARSFLEGASDYLTKPPHPVELIARIRHHTRAYLDRLERMAMLERLERQKRELSEMNARLERMSRTDGLTGIANRMHFDQRLREEWKRARRHRGFLAVALVDVDNFKQYNDAYGHQAGDECLERVAGTLSRTLQRPTDMAARYGGEEFGVILPDTDMRGAGHIAEQLRGAIERLKIPHDHAEAAPHVTISIGVAAERPERDENGPEGLLRRADDALYRAKKGGRNRVATAEPPEE